MACSCADEGEDQMFGISSGSAFKRGCEAVDKAETSGFLVVS